MRLFGKLSLCFLISISFYSVAMAAVDGPACVKAKEVAAHFLSVKTKKKKQIKEFKESSTKFARFTPVFLTGKREGKWVEVQAIDGRSHWLKKRDLSSSMKCLMVRVNKTRMHKGPGTEYEPSEFAERGAVFLDKGGEDGWIQVESSAGLKAWINIDHIWKPTSTMRMSFERE